MHVNLIKQRLFVSPTSFLQHLIRDKVVAHYFLPFICSHARPENVFVLSLYVGYVCVHAHAIRQTMTQHKKKNFLKEWATEV